MRSGERLAVGREMAKVKPAHDVRSTVRNRVNLEENLFISLKSFLIICQVFCTAPARIHCELDPDWSGPESRCSAAGFLRILHLIWSGLVLASVLVSTYFQYTEFDTVMPIIQKALYISEYISNALNVTIVIVGCYWNSKLYRSYFDRIIEIDMKLQALRVQQETLLLRKLLRIFLVSFATFFSIVLAVDFMYNEMNIRAFLRSSTVYTTPNIIALFSLAQYWALIFCVQIRYCKINNVLESKGFKSNAVKGIRVVEAFAESLNPAYTVPKKKMSDSNLHEIINSVRALHADLEHFTSDITMSFGVLIMSVFIASFLILSIQIFALYKMLDGNNLNIYLLAYTLLWIVLHSGRILLVLSANSELIKEKSKTGGLLNGIESINQEIELSVNRFILQIMAQSRAPIVCGIIELDMMILGTIVGGLTTYVIFLIQFDLGSVTLSATTGNHTILQSSEITRKL